MKAIDLSGDSPSLNDLVDIARKEAGVVLMQAGHPVAHVLPVPQSPSTRIAPLHPGAFEVREDFDNPLPDDFWSDRG